MCQIFLAELMTNIAKDSRLKGYGTQAGVFDYGTNYPTVGAFSMRCLKIVVCDISCAVDDIPTETWHLDCVLQPSVHSFTDCN